MSLTRPYVTAGVVLAGAALIVSPIAPPSSQIRTPRVHFLSNDSYLGDSANHLVGLIVGGSGTPIPQLNGDWVDQYDSLYIQRILPGADAEGVFTPEGAEPIFSGVKSLPLNTSIAQDQWALPPCSGHGICG